MHFTSSNVDGHHGVDNSQSCDTCVTHIVPLWLSMPGAEYLLGSLCQMVPGVGSSTWSPGPVRSKGPESRPGPLSTTCTTTKPLLLLPSQPAVPCWLHREDFIPCFWDKLYCFCS